MDHEKYFISYLIFDHIFNTRIFNKQAVCAPYYLCVNSGQCSEAMQIDVRVTAKLYS
jgi:hypothetical protein